MAKQKIDQNKKEKQQALLETAFELFTTKGLERTTIANIAEKAGVAKGTFYLYFKDKYDIRNQLVVQKALEFFQAADQRLLEKGLRGMAPQIHFLVDDFLDFMQNRPDLLVFFSKNLSWGLLRWLFVGMENPPVFQCEILAFSRKNLEERQKDQLLLFTILELVESTSYSCILYGQPVPLDQYRPYLHGCIDGILRQVLSPA